MYLLLGRRAWGIGHGAWGMGPKGMGNSQEFYVWSAIVKKYTNYLFGLTVSDTEDQFGEYLVIAGILRLRTAARLRRSRFNHDFKKYFVLRNITE